MQHIDIKLINNTISLAKDSARLRKNYNFHKEPGDRLQRLLNAIEPGSYIRPHKHENPDKREVFLILTGRVLVVEYTEHGEISGSVILDHALGKFGAEIEARIYHSIVSLEKGSVIYELKDGPYDPLDDKDFAPWAPAEGSPEAGKFLEQLVQKLVG